MAHTKAIAVFAMATISRMVTVLSGLASIPHNGSGQGRPQMVAVNRAHEMMSDAVAMGTPKAFFSPHRLRLKP